MKSFQDRRPSLSCAVAVAVASCCLAAAQATAADTTGPRLPNIVFFLVDDLGWSDVGCNGGRFYETPNVDRLAREGVRFTRAYAACHVCSPTRASILTGKYPARLHLTDWLPGRRDFPFQTLEGAEIHQQLPDAETIIEAVRPILSNHFKPALLARMTIVPYLPLTGEAMKSIVELKLNGLRKRLDETHRITMHVGESVVDQIAERCNEVETGARNIDHIMSRTLLPLISDTLLGAMSEGAAAEALWLDVDENGEYTLSLEEPSK